MSAKNLKAFCWASGLLQLGEEVPEGALELASGPEEVVREIVTVNCRHGYKGELIVPGIPEANGGNQAVDAAIDFSHHLNRCISRQLANQGERHETASRL